VSLPLYNITAFFISNGNANLSKSSAVKSAFIISGTKRNKVSLKDLKKYYNQGHFLEGSMEPKILAAIRFLESVGKKVIISDVEKGWEAFLGKTGTHITK